MSLTRQQKEGAVNEMTDAVKGAAGVVFMSFNGLTMPEVNDLRAKLFAEGVHLRVMPKRLINIVVKNNNLEFDAKVQDGQMAVVWGTDAVTPAKILHAFARKNEHIKLVAGVLEGSVIDDKQVVALAKLPTREQLLGQLVGVMAGPMRGFVSVLSGVPRATVYVLTAIKDQKQAQTA